MIGWCSGRLEPKGTIRDVQAFLEVEMADKADARDTVLDNATVIDEFVSENRHNLGTDDLARIGAWKGFVRGDLVVERDLKRHTSPAQRRPPRPASRSGKYWSSNRTSSISCTTSGRRRMIFGPSPRDACGRMQYPASDSRLTTELPMRGLQGLVAIVGAADLLGIRGVVVRRRRRGAWGETWRSGVGSREPTLELALAPENGEERNVLTDSADGSDPGSAAPRPCSGARRKKALLDSLNALRAAFAKFDPVDLMAAVAGLSLHPPNSNRILRLEACAELAATGRQPAKPKELTRERLLRLIARSSREFVDVVRNEDPFDGPMVEGASVFGRDVRLLPGLGPEDVFSFRKLSQAMDADDLPEVLVPVRALLLGVAATTTEIIRRAELPVACAPETVETSDVVFPPRAAFEKLRDAVRFNAVEFAGHLECFGASIPALAPLTQEVGTRTMPDFSTEDGALTSRPIVHAGDWYIVAAPHCLLRAVFLHLLRDRGDLQRELGSRFHLTCRDWLAAFAPMIAEAAPSKFAPMSGGDGWAFTGWGVEIDVDKVLFIALVTEAGGGVPDLGRLRDVLAANLARIPPDQEVLLLVLYQRLFHPVALPRGAFAGLGAHRLTFSLHDLETLLFAESVGPFRLWYYAGSLDRFEASVTMAAIATPLDLWAFYGDRKHSFYLGDDQPPNFVLLEPCYASEFRVRVAADRRRHGVQHRTEPRAVEVVSASAESRTLSFVAVEERDANRVRVVEAGVPVWIEALDGLHVQDPTVDAVAFWVGELTPYVGEQLLSRRADRPTVVIGVSCSAPTEQESLATASEPPRVDVRPDEGRLNVEIRSMALFATKANEGERDLAGRLYAGLLQLCGASIDDAAVARVVDEIAPLGPKKNLHVSIDTHDPELDATGLPRPRPLRDEVAEQLLDEMGAHLHQLGKFSVGVVDRALLTDAVAYLFGRLRDEVAALSPAGLLETLIAEHEAIIRDTAWRDRTLPAQQAVARNVPAFVEHVTDYMPRLAETAVAGRFLIEYVAAAPPTGSASLSRTRIDHLLSLASMVTNYGTLSDILRHGLVDLHPSLLPSGRLGVDRQRMKAIYEVAHGRRAMTGASRSGALPAPRRTDGSAGPPPWKERLDPLLRAEFGYSLEEYVQVVSVLMKLGFDGHRAVSRRRLSEVVDETASALGMERSAVERILGALSLRPRDAFDNSGVLGKFHVYPWRFNRELSYVRRPLVFREDEGGDWLLWGPRNLYRASRYLLQLITEGRLRAQPGGDLARLISEIAQELHEQFNDDVADWFAGQGFDTRRRVGKFGSARLAGSDGDLGDVDVLVVNTNKRRILAVECKDVHLALAAVDIANQLAELHKKLNRHRRRGEWLVKEAARVQAELNLAPGEWEILCVVVTEETLVSQSYRELPLPVLAFAEVESDRELVWSSAFRVGRVSFTTGG